MRAKEFVINIPISIKINSDGDPEISTGEQEPVDDNVGDFVPPLQQKIELMKKSVGVQSVYDEEGSEGSEAGAVTTGVMDQAFADDDPLDP